MWEVCSGKQSKYNFMSFFVLWYSKKSNTKYKDIIHEELLYYKKT